MATRAYLHLSDRNLNAVSYKGVPFPPLHCPVHSQLPSNYPITNPGRFTTPQRLKQLMSFPNVSALLPSFQRPEDFERAATGRWFCKACPVTPGATRRPFRNDACALAHEKTPLHRAIVASTTASDVWEPNNADWNYQADEDDEQTLGEVKEHEYRQRVEETPHRVDAWVKSWAGFQKKGQMIGVNSGVKRPPVDACIGYDSDFDDLQADGAATDSSKTSDDQEHPHRKATRSSKRLNKPTTYSGAVNVIELPVSKVHPRGRHVTQGPLGHRSPVVHGKPEYLGNLKF